jgi:endonuclease/exonuclease/phosphatase family metal-dependent hydrolase
MLFSRWMLLGFAAVSLGCVPEELTQAARVGEGQETGRRRSALTYYTDQRMVLVTANIRYGCWGESANANGESCAGSDGRRLFTALATQYDYIPDIVALQEIKMAGTTANLHDCGEHATNLRNAILAASGNALSVSYLAHKSDTFGGTCTLLRSGRFNLPNSTVEQTCTGTGGSKVCNTSFPRTGSLVTKMTDNNTGKAIQLANVHFPLPANGGNIRASVNKARAQMTAGAELRIMMGDFNIQKNAGTFDELLRDKKWTEVEARENGGSGSSWTLSSNSSTIDFIWLKGHTSFSSKEVISYPKAGGTYSDHRAVRVIVQGYVNGELASSGRPAENPTPAEDDEPINPDTGGLVTVPTNPVPLPATWAALLPGAGIDMGAGVGAYNVWTLSQVGTCSGGGCIYKWNGSGWVLYPGGATRIAVGNGLPWIVTSAGDLLKFQSDCTPSLCHKTSYGAPDGSARDVGVGANGQVWKIGGQAMGGGNYSVHKMNMSNHTWTVIPDAGAVRIAVGPSGWAWVVNAAGIVYRGDGTLRSDGTYWTQLPPLPEGVARDVGVGSDAYGNTIGWVSSTVGRVYKFDTVGWGWIPYEGMLRDITVDSLGHPWGANDNNQLFGPTGNYASYKSFILNDIVPAPVGSYIDVPYFGADGYDQEFVGDWDGNGSETPGVYRSGTWYLSNDFSGSYHITFGYGGSAGDVAIVGDWNGDGVDTVGIFRQGVFHLNNGFDWYTDIGPFAYGIASDRPIAGDWNGDGIDGVGVVGAGGGLWYWHLSNDFGATNHHVFVFGSSSDHPVVGNWDGIGGDGIGTYSTQDGYFHMSNTLGASYYSHQYGLGTDKPVPGDFNGDGLTSHGITR